MSAATELIISSQRLDVKSTCGAETFSSNWICGDLTLFTKGLPDSSHMANRRKVTRCAATTGVWSCVDGVVQMQIHLFCHLFSGLVLLNGNLDFLSPVFHFFQERIKSSLNF